MSRTFITDVTGVPASPPVSNAVVVGNTCHISGQLGMYDYRYCPASAGVEAAHAFDLVFKVAYAASFSPYDVFFVDIVFSNVELYPSAVVEVCRACFSTFPARTSYEAAKLTFEAKDKVKAVAMRDTV